MSRVPCLAGELDTDTGIPSNPPTGVITWCTVWCANFHHPAEVHTVVEAYFITVWRHCQQGLLTCRRKLPRQTVSLTGSPPLSLPFLPMLNKKAPGNTTFEPRAKENVRLLKMPPPPSPHRKTWPQKTVKNYPFQPWEQAWVHQHSNGHQ